MDTLETYRELIPKVLTEYTLIPYSYGEIEIQKVFDREADHYLVMLVGREQNRRVHGCLIHVDIIDGKIWIQRDGTEYGIVRDFVEAGVPREQIVLGFRPPDRRQITGSIAA